MQLLTSDERVAVLHSKMRAMQHKREGRKNRVVGMASTVLAVCLFVLLFKEGAVHTGGTAGTYCSAMILFESAGGYVLVALAAFIAGVVLSVLLIRRQTKSDQYIQKKESGKQTEWMDALQDDAVAAAAGGNKEAQDQEPADHLDPENAEATKNNH